MLMRPLWTSARQMIATAASGYFDQRPETSMRMPQMRAMSVSRRLTVIVMSYLRALPCWASKSMPPAGQSPSEASSRSIAAKPAWRIRGSIP